MDEFRIDREEAAGGVPGRRGMGPVDDAGQDDAESPHGTPARPAASSQPVADWRTLRRGDRVKVLDPIVGDVWGTVERVEPCKAADSVWVYVQNGGPVVEMVLLIDGLPSRLEQ